MELFLREGSGMSFFSAILFGFIGIILILLVADNRRASDIAHVLCFPVSVGSYLIPVSYLLIVDYIHKFFGESVALNSGIAFCAVCVAIFAVKPDTWLMTVFSSPNTGGIMARRLLPWIAVLPVSIGWLRTYGVSTGIFVSETGVLLVEIAYAFCFILLIWFSGRSVNQIDKRRVQADEALKRSYDELEEKVRERTSELLKLNQTLDTEIKFRAKAEAMVESERRRMNGLLEIMPAYLILLTPDYQVAYSNRFFRERFGVSNGRRCYEFLFNRTEPCEICETFKVLDDNKPHEWEWTGPDGNIYSISDFPYKDADGSPLIMEMGIDVTSLKKAEENLVTLNLDLEQRVKDRTKELFNTKNYLQNLIDYANAPIIVWDQENRIRLFNHAFEHLTSYTSAEVEGRNLDLLFPEDSMNESMKKIRSALTKNWETIEIPILTKTNEIRIVLWNSAKIYDENRKTFSTIAQGNDITERIKAEVVSRESKEKLEIALESGKIGTWEWNLETNALVWDERMEMMFGRTPGTHLYTFDEFKTTVHDEDMPHVKNAITQALAGDKPLNLVYRIVTNGNKISHISAKGVIEKDSSGKPVKMTGVCFDITEMKKGAENALFALNENLLRSNKELEQFAYVASHDLQEPLRMVSSYTQLLARRYNDKLDQDARDFIQYAVDGAVRMQILINDLLDYSRIETKGRRFDKVDMHSVLGQVINNLGFLIQEKNALVTNDELPEVVADEGQMVQLLQNIVMNALKFCNNSPRVHISAKEEKDQYIFSVNDNGFGIEPQYFGKIFQIFQRLHPREEYGGTGIGLAICKRIIERHGGRIWVESEPEKGSVFYFTLLKR